MKIARRRRKGLECSVTQRWAVQSRGLVLLAPYRMSFHHCVPILSSHGNKRTVLICNSMILFDFLSRYHFSHYDSLDNQYFCIYIIWYSFNCLKKELEAYRYFRSSIKNNLKMCVSVCACMCARMPRVCRCLWRPEDEAGCSEDGIMEWSWATQPGCWKLNPGPLREQKMS